MRNWLFRLRAAILFSEIHPHITFAPKWTAEDAKALSKFLTKTQTGAKYRKILWHHIQSATQRATMERNHAAYECGYASGARGLIAVADSLLAVRAEKDEKEETLSPDLEALIP